MPHSRPATIIGPRAFAMLAVGLSTALLVSACGSSGGGGGSSAGAGGSAGSTGGASAVRAAAAAAIAPYLTAPSSIGVDVPLPKSVKGMTFDYIQCSVPECVRVGEQMGSAAKVLGVTLRRVDAGQSPQSFVAGFNKAIQDKPDVVLEAAIDPAFVKPQLAKLAAAHIPVVAWTVPDAPGNGIVANLLPKTENEFDGKIMADFALAKSPKTVHAVAFTATEFSVFGPQTAAFKAEIKAKCPKCSADVVQASIADVGTVIPGRVVSYLQQHPDTNVIQMAFGTLLTGVPEAMKAAGVGQNAMIVSQAGGTPNWQYVRSGQQTTDLALDLNYFGWKAMDAAARAATGSSLAPDQKRLPIEFLTKSNLTFGAKQPFIAIPTYRQQFTKLWSAS